MAQGKAEDTGGPTPPHLFDRRILPFFKCAGDTLPSLAERGGGTERSRYGHVCEKCPLDKPIER